MQTMNRPGFQGTLSNVLRYKRLHFTGRARKRPARLMKGHFTVENLYIVS